MEKFNENVGFEDDAFWEQLEYEELRRKSKGTLKPSGPEYALFENLLEGMLIIDPKPGSIVTGRYAGLQSGQHQFFVDGFKDYLHVDERPSENNYLKNTNINDTLDIIVLGVDDDNYFISGSIAMLYESRAHETLMNLDGEVTVEAYIKNTNPAGYDIDILHDGVTLPAFMPNTLAGINKLHDPESIVKQTFKVIIESFSSDEGTYIVSRRKYLKSLIPEAIKQIEIGGTYEGHVTGTTPFGVFVEFNDCLTGMIHKANIVEEWQDRITDIKPGQRIEFFIKEVILNKNKIILTQVWRETLWDTISIGQQLTGKVRSNKSFGSLISLDEETVGLLHSSELARLGLDLEPGDEVDVKVLAVDRPTRKIFLTGGK